jgi:diaminopimelate epimerase
MGTPRFQRSEIPAAGQGEYEEEIAGYTVYAVNTGVPHAVVFVDDVDAVDLEEIGPIIRNHRTFPQGANVNVAERVGGLNSLRIRTFERGVEAETFSCGTGATAAAVVAEKLGYVRKTASVETRGGPLVIHLGKTVDMAGPAYTVFIGIIPS